MNIFIQKGTSNNNKFLLNAFIQGVVITSHILQYTLKFPRILNILHL